MAPNRLVCRAIPRCIGRQPFASQTPRFLSTAKSSAESSKVANPVSSGPESQFVNTSRGKESRASDVADSRSTQSPISPSKREHPSEAHEGEEETSFDEYIKNDPNASPETKRRNVEKAGQKPMGPEDS